MSLDLVSNSRRGRLGKWPGRRAGPGTRTRSGFAGRAGRVPTRDRRGDVWWERGACGGAAAMACFTAAMFHGRQVGTRSLRSCVGAAAMRGHETAADLHAPAESLQLRTLAFQKLLRPH